MIFDENAVCSSVHAGFRGPTSLRHPPDMGPTWPRLLRLGPRPVQFVDVGLAPSAVMHDQIFQLFQAVQMRFRLRVAPAGMGAHVAAAKEKTFAAGAEVFDQGEKLPRLRRQLVERAASSSSISRSAVWMSSRVASM